MKELRIDDSTAIGFKNELINASMYIDSIELCIAEMCEVKDCLESEINRLGKDFLSPCLNDILKRFSNYNTLAELSHEKLKNTFSKIELITQKILID